MKKTLFASLVFGIGVTSNINAQIFDKLKNKVKQKADQRMDQKTDKAIDKTLDKVDGTEKKNASTNENNNSKSDNNSKRDEQSAGSYLSLKSYSKYDFVPGNKIIYADDFSQEVIGEFPVSWNTNGMGEIVTLENLPGKWLQLKNEMKYVTGLKTKLPDNCTIEFDLLAEFIPEKGIPPYISFIVLSNNSSAGNAELGDNLPGVNLNFRLNTNRPDGDELVVNSRDAERSRYFDGEYAKNSAVTEMNRKKKPVHVALWIQKQRLRVWLNDKKVYDAPKVIPTGIDLNRMRIDVFGQASVPGSQYYISNFKVAEAMPDTRSKLITEGKWSTNGILFDVNSDKIKPTSFGVLKEIAATLNENPTVQVKIIGHTDTDGDASKNLDLSRRRAASVKSALASDFSIDPSRLQTDGIGGSKPIADNKTAEGKAQNRRVEFIKL